MSTHFGDYFDTPVLEDCVVTVQCRFCGWRASHTNSDLRLQALKEHIHTCIGHMTPVSCRTMAIGRAA